jgi:hypothetical protein
MENDPAVDARIEPPAVEHIKELAGIISRSEKEQAQT